ncbi:MAG: sialate O-acetylesterase [Rubripirellula sp.]
MIRSSCFLVLVALMAPMSVAEVKMSPIFGDSMVVQRDMPIHVWGWTKPNTEVKVDLAGHEGAAQSDASGRFDVKLDPLSAGGPHELTIEADETKTFKDVLVGEVWVCSGQSNMAWTVSGSNDPDLETLTAKYPNLRLISVPQVASQEPKNEFEGKWEACTPETVKSFSAVGYFFGRQLHQTLDVPVGLIDNAWGGSAAEAWVRRDVLEQDGKYDELIAKWDGLANTYDHDAAVDKWKERVAAWEKNKKGGKPRAPRNVLAGQHRPANLYNGVLFPVLGYTIRGVIWYQGESNAGRAYQYRDLFPLMIDSWRKEWGQGDFPFYWVQLADFRPEVDQPGDSDWAELREAQTMTMAKLPHTGEAVITDLGEASDIHPKNKQDVAKRLARWALANEYGFDIPFHSPSFESMSVEGSKAVLKFDHVGGRLDTFDVQEPIGFAIAGEDKVFVAAQAKITGKDTIEVWSDEVANPVAVRYAWANNPICNVQSSEGLPMTPFRTDDWPGVTAEVTK